MCPKTSPSSTKWRLESYAVIVTHCVPVHISCLRPISTPHHLSRTSSISPRTQDRSSRAPPMGSLDTASLRSSSVSQLTRLTRTPRHPLMSRSLTCSLSQTCSGSRSARPEHGARLVRSPLAPGTPLMPRRQHVYAQPPEDRHV